MGFDLFFRIHKFKVVLNEKEESVRKLKELLRKSQQHGEESCKKMALDQSHTCLYQMNWNQAGGDNEGWSCWL